MFRMLLCAAAALALAGCSTTTNQICAAAPAATAALDAYQSVATVSTKDKQKIAAGTAVMDALCVRATAAP